MPAGQMPSALCDGHAGGGPADDRVAASVLQLEVDGRTSLVRCEVQVQVQSPRCRRAVPLGIDRHSPGRPTPLRAPAEAAETRERGLIRPARVRVRELLAGDLRAHPVRHAVGVGGQVVDGPAGRPEATGPRGKHYRFGAEHHQSVGVHGDSHGPNHAAVHR